MEADIEQARTFYALCKRRKKKKKKKLGFCNTFLDYFWSTQEVMSVNDMTLFMQWNVPFFCVCVCVCYKILM